MIEPPFATEAENTAWQRGWSDAANGRSNISETDAVPENVKEAYRRGYEGFLEQGLKV